MRWRRRAGAHWEHLPRLASLCFHRLLPHPLHNTRLGDVRQLTDGAGPADHFTVYKVPLFFFLGLSTVGSTNIAFGNYIGSFKTI